MPQNPPEPPAPRPVIPIDLPPQAAQPAPVIPIAEPGVVAPAPFAQVYAPPPVPPTSYYPPAYPPAWPEPVGYRSAGSGNYARPGIITSLAVTGIIVASLSFLTSLFSGCTGLMVMGSAQRAGSTARVSAPLPTARVTTPSATVAPAGPNGLASNDRAVVLRALRKKHLPRTITAERERQLDGFFAEHGRLLLNPRPTSKSISDQISQTGQEYANAGQERPDFFVFKPGPSSRLSGRLIVYNDHSIFRSDDHTTDLRSAVKPPPVDPIQEPETQAASALEDYQVQALLNRTRELSNNLLNPAQTSTLTSLLQSPARANWVEDSSTVPGLTAQIKSAAVRDDGSVSITFTMGTLTLDPQGNVAGQSPQTATQSFSTTSPAAGAAPFMVGPMGVSTGSCALVIGEAAISGLLAIYLLVVAILSLRQTGAPRMLYVMYGFLKLLCGIAAIVGFSWMIRSMDASYDPTGFTRSMVAGFKGMATAALTISAIGIVYPIAVLLTLALNKTARDYYKSGM